MGTPGRNIMLGNDPQLTENATQKFARKRAEAQKAADALNGYRADTTTPLDAPDATEQPADEHPARPVIILSTTIIYRGRQITISNDGMTLDAFCDMLDRRLPL